MNLMPSVLANACRGGALPWSTDHALGALLLACPFDVRPACRHTADTRTRDYEIRDPLLTEEGREQCVALQKDLKSTIPREFMHKPVRLIIVSPLKRCIETAQLSLDWLIEAGVPMVADADWQGTPESLHHQSCDLRDKAS
jgi:phosphohistidine phosphatase SixA